MAVRLSDLPTFPWATSAHVPLREGLLNKSLCGQESAGVGEEGKQGARVLVRGSEGWDPRPRIGSIHAKPEGVNWRDCGTVEALKQQEALSLKISS